MGKMRKGPFRNYDIPAFWKHRMLVRFTLEFTKKLFMKEIRKVESLPDSCSQIFTFFR